MRTRLSVVVSAFLLAALAAPAQTPTTIRDLEKPSFELAPDRVRLDVYATADGQAVGDLAQSDLSLYEDTAQQTLTSFARVPANPGAPRLFVVYLDTYHLPLDVAAAVRLPLVKFIDRLAGPDDRVALMTPEMSPADVPVVRKAAVMSDLMQEVTAWARRGRSVSGNDAKDDLYAGCYTGSRREVADAMIERHHEMASLEALDNLVDHLGRTGADRKVVITVTDGWRVFTPDQGLLRDRSQNRGQGVFGGFGGGGRGSRRSGGNAGGDDSRATSSQMAECESDRGTLAMLDDAVRLRRIEDDANRATVTLYAVLASGVAPPSESAGDRQRADRGDERRSRPADRAVALRELADTTDGMLAIDARSLDATLARIVSDTGSHYLVTYTSSNARLDGRFRAITVRTTRPGVQVRTRRGYRGATAEELADAAGEGTPVAAALRTVAASGAQGAFRVRTSTWFPSSMPGATLWIVGELDYRVRKELTWSAGATGDVVVIAADGREVASQPVDVRPATGRFEIRVSGASNGLAPGDYAVRVRLHPDADPATTVTETARVQVSTEQVPLGQPVLWRRGPSTGPRFMTTADPRFERTERIRVELPTTAMGTPVAHLLDRAGSILPVPVPVSTRQDQAGGFRWIVADLALAPLGLGDYAIAVTVGGAKQVAAFSLVP
ncbi:MAG TPA: VWA domain-containing protein [Vicinamibacterales bacterium]|nr:VWA domain-containing protein [Vicinamibacterales bacterium]